MIYDALLCITEEINEYFSAKLKINEDKVILSGIINQDGSIAASGENKILLTLINIERENIGKNNGAHINLYVLFSAYFGGGNYPEALRFLSFIIGYLQSKSVFSKSNTPKMGENIEKLIFEMENLSTERLNNVWATLGAKYMPSVCYKVRMLVFDDTVIREFRPVVSGITNENVPLK
jgi:uncharacterized membrane protein